MGGYIAIYRPINVLLIAIAQILCAFFLDVDASLQNLYTGGLHFLVLGTLSCVVFGYWINDFSDQQRDAINKSKVKAISHLSQMMVYIHLLIFVSTALWCGRYLGVWFAGLFLITLVLLTSYSVWLKNTPFLGNILIAALHFVSIFSVYKLFPEIDIFLILHFAVLSGFIALAREIVKDLEDKDGDIATGAETIPIVFGQNIANIMVYVILLFTLSFSLVSFYLQKDYFQAPLLYLYYTYVAFFIVVPLYYIAVDIRYASKKEEYTRLSLWLKYVIFVGILSILFF